MKTSAPFLLRAGVHTSTHGIRYQVYDMNASQQQNAGVLPVYRVARLPLVKSSLLLRHFLPWQAHVTYTTPAMHYTRMRRQT